MNKKKGSSSKRKEKKRFKIGPFIFLLVAGIIVVLVGVMGKAANMKLMSIIGVVLLVFGGLGLVSLCTRNGKNLWFKAQELITVFLNKRH